MKKVTSSLAGFLFLLITLVACKKESIQSNKLPENDLLSEEAKIENGRLSFSTTVAYENFLSMPDKQEFYNTLPGNNDFTSFKEKNSSGQNQQSLIINGCEVPDELVEDNPVFFNMINAEGIVEISGTLYRYDYCGDRVWVISANNSTESVYYADFMAGIERPGIVGYFPNDIDAIEAVAAGYTTMPDETVVRGNEIFERTGLLGATTKENFYIVNNDRVGERQKMDGKLSYDKFAVYFHFYGKEKYQTQCTIGNYCTSSTLSFRDWNVTYSYTYHRKGHSNPTYGAGALSPSGYTQNETAKTFYDGGRGLKTFAAQWDVGNVLTKSVRVERNGGSTWTQIGSYTLPTFQRRNNYFFPGFPNINSHFRI